MKIFQKSKLLSLLNFCFLSYGVYNITQSVTNKEPQAVLVSCLWVMWVLWDDAISAHKAENWLPLLKNV